MASASKNMSNGKEAMAADSKRKKATSIGRGTKQPKGMNHNAKGSTKKAKFQKANKTDNMMSDVEF